MTENVWSTGQAESLASVGGLHSYLWNLEAIMADKSRNRRSTAGKQEPKLAFTGARKSAGQTPRHYERDPKRRRGQYGGAGDAPLVMK